MDLKEIERIRSLGLIIELRDGENRRFFYVQDANSFYEGIWKGKSPVDPPSYSAVEEALTADGKEITVKDFEKAEKHMAFKRQTGNRAWVEYRAQLSE